MIGVMIQTAFLVIAILAVQKLFGDKLHAYVRYGLWLLVVLRLAVPVNFINSPFSMLQVAETIRLSDAVRKSADLQKADSAEPADILNEQEASPENILQSVSVGMDAENVLPMESTTNTATDVTEIEASDSGQTDAVLWTDGADRNDTARRINMKHIQLTVTEAYLSGTINKVWSGIWLTGSLLIGGFLGLCQFRFRRKLYRARTAYRGVLSNMDNMPQIPIYRVKNLESPCLVGLLTPIIYIGADIATDSDYFRYAIIHEKVHYLHRDHLWAYVRALLVIVYWFHPFVWLAAAHSVRDGELACDYGTVRRLGQKEKLAYSEMLLKLSQARRGKRVYTYGTMLRPRKSELKERILRLTKKNGSRVWAGVLAVLLMVIAAGCAFTGAAEINNGKTILLVNEAGKDSAETDVDDSDKDTNTGNAEGENPSEDENLSGIDNTSARGNNPENENADNFETQQIEVKTAEITLATPFGADGPRLDYAGGMGTDKGSRIIFHDYFGLIVYDLSNREIVRSLDLASIGCDMTQGDDYCQVVVSADGETVWLHPMSKRYMYRYEVEENLLYQEPLVKTLELDLEGEELFDRYLNLSMEPEYTDENTDWWWHSNYLYEQYKDEQGLYNAYIYLYASPDSISDTIDYKLMLRNLNCVWDDMVFTLFERDANAPDSAEIPIEAVYFSHDPTIQDSADIPEEIQHERFQDNRTDGVSEASSKDGFSYRYNGGVEDIIIMYDNPCDYTRISDLFGERIHPITGEVRVHDGIDFAAAEGTDITAAADGVVYEMGYSAEHGNYVVLLHVNGDMTYYCHCREITVEKDDQVKRGGKIATVGSTGQATGSFLHFALSKDGAFVNPQNYMEDIFSYGMN